MTPGRDPGLVVVGVDGSQPASAAPSYAGLQAEAERVLQDAAAAARAAARDVPVETELVAGGAVMRAAEGAALLVVGHRGLHGARLLVVHAWTASWGRDDLDAGGYRDAVESGRPAGRAVLDAAVAEVARLQPGVAVEGRLVDRAAADLVAASAEARLVVIGSRGAGALSGLLLGSIAHALIRHAACPVLVHRTAAPPE